MLTALNQHLDPSGHFPVIFAQLLHGQWAHRSGWPSRPTGSWKTRAPDSCRNPHRRATAVGLRQRGGRYAGVHIEKMGVHRAGLRGMSGRMPGLSRRRDSSQMQTRSMRTCAAPETSSDARCPGNGDNFELGGGQVLFDLGSRDGATHALLEKSPVGVPVICTAAKARLRWMAARVVLGGRCVLAVQHLLMPGLCLIAWRNPDIARLLSRVGLRMMG